MVEDRWVADRAEKRDILWGKVRGHPFWPMQLIPHDVAITNYLSDCKSPPTTACCMFFGTWQIAWLRSDDVIEWSLGIERGLHYHVKHRKAFDDALYEVCIKLTLRNSCFYCHVLVVGIYIGAIA